MPLSYSVLILCFFILFSLQSWEFSLQPGHKVNNFESFSCVFLGHSESRVFSCRVQGHGNSGSRACDVLVSRFGVGLSARRPLSRCYASRHHLPLLSRNFWGERMCYEVQGGWQLKTMWGILTFSAAGDCGSGGFAESHWLYVVGIYWKKSRSHFFNVCMEERLTVGQGLPLTRLRLS